MKCKPWVVTELSLWVNEYEILWFAFYKKIIWNERFYLWIHFAYWLFLEVYSWVFWQECLIEVLEPVWVRFPHLGLLELCQLKYIITCIVILLLGSSKIYTICNHSFEGQQAFPVLHCCRFHMVSVGQHCQSGSYQSICLPDFSSIKCDCWHHFACCSMSNVKCAT